MGYDPNFGGFMKLWSNESINSNNEQDNSCCGIEEINGAKLVCNQFGVPHYTIDFTKVFKEEVVNNFSKNILLVEHQTPVYVVIPMLNGMLLLNKLIK